MKTANLLLLPLLMISSYIHAFEPTEMIKKNQSYEEYCLNEAKANNFKRLIVEFDENSVMEVKLTRDDILLSNNECHELASKENFYDNIAPGTPLGTVAISMQGKIVFTGTILKEANGKNTAMPWIDTILNQVKSNDSTVTTGNFPFSDVSPSSTSFMAKSSEGKTIDVIMEFNEFNTLQFADGKFLFKNISQKMPLNFDIREATILY